MSKIDFDKVYQNAVDKEAGKLIYCSIIELLDKNDYGSIEVVAHGIKINIGWQKWQRSENCYHIVFTAQRKLRFFFYRKYLKGIKFDITGKDVEYLSAEETGDYD